MLFFSNPGEIDVRLITSFGVNVKENPESAIGYFGTGLKYAIAITLRLGGRVEIWSGLTQLSFRKDESEIRGKSFEFVQMSESEGPWQTLGFTTELGKTWEPWMALREFYCNALDEGGSEVFEAEARIGTTLVVIECPQIEAAWKEREKFFIPPEVTPEFTFSGGEIEAFKSTDAKKVFYKGIAVGQLTMPTLFNYNFKKGLQLTEDRSIKNGAAGLAGSLARAVMAAEDEELITKFTIPSSEKWEASWDYWMSEWDEPSKVWMEVVGRLLNSHRSQVPLSIQKVFEKYKEKTPPISATLTPVQRRMLEKAQAFCLAIGHDTRVFPIMVVDSLGGEDILGRAEEGRILISLKAFRLGTKQVTSTLLEEFIHLKLGCNDFDRAMQNFLFDSLISLGEELNGEPL